MESGWLNTCRRGGQGASWPTFSSAGKSWRKRPWRNGSGESRCSTVSSPARRVRGYLDRRTSSRPNARRFALSCDFLGRSWSAPGEKRRSWYAPEGGDQRKPSNAVRQAQSNSLTTLAVHRKYWIRDLRNLAVQRQYWIRALGDIYRLSSPLGSQLGSR